MVDPVKGAMVGGIGSDAWNGVKGIVVGPVSKGPKLWTARGTTSPPRVAMPAVLRKLRR